MLAPVTLSGRLVVLVPLAAEHLDPLWEAAQNGDFPLTTVPGSREAMHEYIASALAERSRGKMLPFVTTEKKTGRLLGSTRFADLQRWEWPSPYQHQSRAEGFDSCEIGWTWLIADARRTLVNTEAKRLMLGHAFESWGVRCVRLKTDARNARSRGAMERLGARFDGILRAHMPGVDGAVRDSAFYSLLREEWPALRQRLDARLSGE
jgi:RimJ/RimL family protein N-acetyltransferase